MQKVRKSIYRRKTGLGMDQVLVLATCLLFTIIGIFLSVNEVNADDWIIESIADGLLGDKNRTLFTVGPNFIITSIIYLLSQTGLRLFWLNWILTIMQAISSFLICKIIVYETKGPLGISFSVLFLILITPAGCLWLIFALKHKKSYISHAFGIMWVVLGNAIRPDCLYFAMPFMGSLWFMELLRLLQTEQFRNKKVKKKEILRWLTPFLIILVFVITLGFLQQYMINSVNPGFTKWNEVRFKVDDYKIPDYYERVEDYQNIGMSYTDYLLLRSMNNQDPDFFTEELYEKILDISNNYKENMRLLQAIVVSLECLSGEIYFWICALLTIFAFLFRERWHGFCCAIVLVCQWILTAYFLYSGRLIWRTEWPIWMFTTITMFGILSSHDENEIKTRKCKRYKLYCFLLIFTMLFVKPNNVNPVSWDMF